MKEEFITRDATLLKSMMFNICSVLNHESNPSKKNKVRRKSIFTSMPKEKIGKTRHHNVMLELDSIKSDNTQHLCLWNKLVEETRDTFVNDP